MNILIAADAFKDALPAPAVCRAIERGLQSGHPTVSTRCFPLADGGEGTYEILSDHLALSPVELEACDPLGRPLRSVYGRSKHGETAFIELAKTAGLQLLAPEERNPLLTSTYGTGLQIAHALRSGVRRLVLAIGGSATNDAGMGMATALGWQFADISGNRLAPAGVNLERVQDMIEPTGWDIPETMVICDVTNPLYGPQGAAFVYARQKGADDAAIYRLDAGLRHFSAIARRHWPHDLSAYPGAGAAGGMGFGALLFLNARLQPGIDLVMDLTGFDRQMDWADLVITGEGSLDAQTMHGKLIRGICRRAARLKKPVVAFCGKLEASAAALADIGLQSAHPINPPGATDLPEMLRTTERNLEKAAQAFAVRLLSQ